MTKIPKKEFSDRLGLYVGLILARVRSWQLAFEEFFPEARFFLWGVVLRHGVFYTGNKTQKHTGS
jgi:hypothetical protein